ncbi:MULTISPECIES: aconitase/3-isopropylmalate dehydratase large subunit family protein [Methanoculleus]|uniref:3-isopropylmalate dehydratase large subunit n=2 Tax=Methanoculleus TaxID=45989 RepID=A3CT67_METMJ|nr:MULTISPECIES: aconitase/3-isopropylmalate dehydratase large subunit family protein [Methanoculleus]ABN56567.1 3-isopropylmalate dehydratase, large subunit [Methanoculleus marisnigri JR1]MCC7555188.1 3-isopropylmalate dehydratase large subunit [Methanoculleus marisnigri]UYU18006.1 aconitase/3-isopropylmalate dehydratase large subunit family protein [Methanoculleus submarinus]
MSTLSEAILGAPAGEYVDREVDIAFAHDGTGVLAREALREMGVERLPHPERLRLVFDHIVPANTGTTATLQAELREYAGVSGIALSDAGGGICHQVMGEGVVRPGMVVVGADSHTCTLGAFGAFATGVGATDMAAIWASGETWFRVPETIAVNLSGRLSGAAEPKDVALAYVAELGMEGATYRALEFVGDGAAGISMDGRLTLSNMAVETGAKTGMFYADAVTVRYLADYGVTASPQAPEDCRYERTVEIDLDDIVPLVAVPHRVDTVREAEEVAGTHLDQVFVGTCTNGRYEDLARFARIVRGKKVAVRTLVFPASRSVLARAIATGVLADIVDAGCVVGSPGCGPCLGAHAGVIGEGEVCLSTANRNFKNRMGVGGEIYLSSVATAAASAITGVITVPEVV